MRSVLFICTGNYYRSRFAEIIFNHFSRRDGVAAHAFSRGMRLNPEKNKGVLSPHAYSYLTELSISTVDPGVPTKLEAADLHRAAHIILLDEKEHRPMFMKIFPEWETKVEYWQFEDDYLTPPAQVLPNLKLKVERLIQTISNNSFQ